MLRHKHHVAISGRPENSKKSRTYGKSTFWVGNEASRRNLGWGILFLTAQTVARDIALRSSTTPPSIHNNKVGNIILNVHEAIEKVVGPSKMLEALNPSMSSTYTDVP
jgi:hypothetical protein